MSSEIELIQSALNRSFFKLLLPVELEKAFKDDCSITAAETFKTNSAILTIAFFIILALTLSILDTTVLEEWPIACGVIFVALATVGVLVRIPSLNKYYQFYTGALASIVLTASSAIPYFMEGQVMYQITLVASIYCIVIVYTMAKLLFFHALFWCLLSVIFTWLVLDYLSVYFDWLTFHLHITAGHIFGITLAYIIEHREKKLFLNSRLLQLEKAELFQVKKIAEQRSETQRKISKFLESLSSDQSLSSLGAKILIEMSALINFKVGAVYSLEKNDLVRIGGYALSAQNSQRVSYSLNQTLLGAAVQNKKIDIVKNLPPSALSTDALNPDALNTDTLSVENLSVASGTGNAKAASLLVMPIIFEGRAIGGLELGSFENFNEVDIEFIEGIKLGLGITLNSCINKSKYA